MIVKANEIPNVQDTNIVMLIFGAPGVGKTTLACSAEKTFLIDADHGLKRVAVKHRADSSDSKSYEEILADVKEAKNLGYETLAIDTGCALQDAMIQYIGKTNDKMIKADGNLSLQGYGALKNTFLSFSAMVRANFKNTIFLFHEDAKRDGDNIFYDIIASGAAKNLVWTPVDLGCRMFMRGGHRYLGFTPTEEYSAKSSFGIKGLIEVPTIEADEANNFLEKLFSKARANLKAEAEALAPKNAEYEEAMKNGMLIISALEKPENVPEILEALKTIKHASTSEKELKNALKKAMADKNIVYDGASKTYKYGETK